MSTSIINPTKLQKQHEIVNNEKTKENKVKVRKVHEEKNIEVARVSRFLRKIMPGNCETDLQIESRCGEFPIQIVDFTPALLELSHMDCFIEHCNKKIWVLQFFSFPLS